MLPSASMGNPDGPGVFEPCHGSAPDIAGQDKANPLVRKPVRRHRQDRRGVVPPECPIPSLLSRGPSLPRKP